MAHKLSCLRDINTKSPTFRDLSTSWSRCWHTKQPAMFRVRPIAVRRLFPRRWRCCASSTRSRCGADLGGLECSAVAGPYGCPPTIACPPARVRRGDPGAVHLRRAAAARPVRTPASCARSDAGDRRLPEWLRRLRRALPQRRDLHSSPPPRGVENFRRWLTTSTLLHHAKLVAVADERLNEPLLHRPGSRGCRRPAVRHRRLTNPGGAPGSTSAVRPGPCRNCW